MTETRTEARILVVDDNAVNIRVFEAALRPRGLTVIGAGSGQEALDVIGRESIDLVLLDINMPGMNGYEVCRRIRETPAVAMVPIVMVTASSDEERLQALEAGADDFLRRPFDQTELLARVASLLRIKRYHDALEGQAAELSAWNQTLEEQVAGAVMELERLRSLRRFLSPQLADAVLASNDAVLEPHRGQVAVLSCALQGFPSFVATCEPEEVLETLGTFHRVLGGVVEESAATVGSAATDEVTLFFNDPLPVDQPVARAVAAAMTLRERMAVQVESWRRRGYALTVGAGLAYGYATLGRIGFEGRYDYTAVGPVVALAGRLRDAAPPGAVLVPAAVREDLAGTVECERLDGVSLPGFQGVTELWSVVGRRTGDPAPVVIAPPTRSPVTHATGSIGAIGATGAPAGVELRVLGPIEVWAGGRPVPITAAKERALLALLVVHRGVVLSVDWLADELWSGDPPDSALAALRVYVSRLRKTLSAGGVADLLVTRSTGYAVDVPAEVLDAARFDTLASAGHRQLADGDAKAARDSLDEALALWRGPALPELVDAPASRNEAVRLEEARLTAVEDRLEARLLCGEHREVVAELEALTRSHPMRQRMWGQRMVALHWSGRQPEAIRAYQELRDDLVQIGLEPGAELVELERAIVAASPELPWPPP